MRIILLKKLITAITALLLLLQSAPSNQLLGAATEKPSKFTSKLDRFEIKSISTIPEAGEIKTDIMKTEPKVILNKWSGEVKMGVKYNDIQATGVEDTTDGKIKWKGVKEELHAYPLDAKEGMEDGGFEIEVVLNEKPTKNTFDFTIDGAENLDFFYQPALTQSEIDEGAERPPEVIGSYAVYHKTKANHKTGSTNYATGKAYHIYRPKAIDANGNWTWVELSYDEKLGIMHYIIPVSWLEAATYPVKF